MKKIFSILIICILVLPFTSFAASTIENSGIIDRTVWLSKESLVEGDSVDVYTVVWNGGNSSLSGNVVFYDGTTLLGKRTVNLSPKTTKVVSLTWKVSAGNHNITTSFESANVTDAKGQNQSVLVENSKSASLVVSVKSKNTTTAENQIKDFSSDVKNKTPLFVENAIDSIDSLRVDWSDKIADLKEKSKSELPNKKTPSATVSVPLDSENGIGTPKLSTDTELIKSPFAYVKYFGYSLLSFILSSKLVFYGVVLLVIFIILKSIFRKKD